jgi:hypothetical protein
MPADQRNQIIDGMLAKSGTPAPTNTSPAAQPGAFQTHKGSPIYNARTGNLPEDSDLPAPGSIKGIARKAILPLAIGDELRKGARGLEAQSDAADYNRRAALASGQPDPGMSAGQVAGEFGAAGLRTAAGLTTPAGVGLTAATALAPEVVLPAAAAYGIGHGGAKTIQGGYGLATSGATPENVGNALQGAGEMLGGATAVPASRALLRPPVPEQNAAIQSVLDPGWGKRQAFQEDLATARPYLGGQGISSVEDLQNAIPGAKDEIWQPAQQGFNRFGDEPVQGPDGPTTYNGLEARRREISAQLQGIRDKDPATLQTILQQGKNPANLADEQAHISNLLDDRMSREGINFTAIRNAFGGVKGIERQVSGTNTLSEKPQRYGFGKVASNLSINPFKLFGLPGGIAEAASDIAAGRPLWSGKPTDVGIAEGLQTGGEKPSFVSTRYPQPIGPPLAPPTNVPPPNAVGAVEATGQPQAPNQLGGRGRAGLRVNVLPTEHPGEGNYAGLLPGPPAPFVPPPPGPPVPQVGGLPPAGFPVETPNPMWTGEARPGIVPTRGPAAQNPNPGLTTPGRPGSNFQGPTQIPSPLWDMLPSFIKESMFRGIPPNSTEVTSQLAPPPTPPVTSNAGPAPNLTPQETSALRFFLQEHPRELQALETQIERGTPAEQAAAKIRMRELLQGRRKQNSGPPAGTPERRNQ